MSTRIGPLPATGSPASPAAGGLLRALGTLVLRRKTWVSFSLFGVLARLVANPGAHGAVLALRGNPVYRRHLAVDPRFLFKYLTHGYMARNLAVAERAACFLHHYRRLYAELPDSLLQTLLTGELELADFPAAKANPEAAGKAAACPAIRITLGRSDPWDKEGELSLNLRVDGQLAAVLAFTIVPGWAVGSEQADVLLISRLQGERGAHALLRRATRSMCQVAAPALLVAALEGVSRALDIPAVAAVTAVGQTSYRKLFDQHFRSAYDEFFRALGWRLNAHGFHESAFPLPEKPLSAVKHGHKLRTRTKREWKRALTVEIAAAVQALRRQRLLPFPAGHTTPQPGEPAGQITQRQDRQEICSQ